MSGDPVLDSWKPAGTAPVDPVLEAWRQGERARLAQASAGAADHSPEQFTQARDVAQRTGLPVGVVARNPEHAARVALDQDLTRITAQNPALSAWLGEKPERLQVAKDDLGPLAAMEQWFTGAKDWGARQLADLKRASSTFGQRFGAADVQMVGQVAQTAGETLEPNYDPMGYLFRYLEQGAQERGNTADAAKWRALADAITEANPVARGGRSITQGGREAAHGAGLALADIHAAQPRPTSLRSALANPGATAGYYGGMTVESLPAVLAAMAARNPELAAGVMGGTAGAQGYSQAREDGAGRLAATQSALVQGVAETGFAHFPLAEAFGGRPTLQRALYTALKEGATEGATTVAQTTGDAFFTGKQVDQQALAANTVDSMIIGGGLGVPEALLGGNGTADRLHQVAAQWRAEEQLHQMGEVNDLAAQLKTAKRAPEEVGAYVRMLVDRSPHAPTTVYVDAAALVNAYRAKRLDPFAEAAKLTGNPDALSLAVDAGADIAVPLDAYVPYVASSPHADAVTGLARLSPGTLHPADPRDLQPAPGPPLGDVATVEANLRAEYANLPPNVAAEYARTRAAQLVGAEDTVTAATAEQGLAGLDFAGEHAALGITEKQWADYQAQLVAASDEARSRVVQRVSAAEGRTAEEWYAAEHADVAQQVHAELGLPAAERARAVLAGASEADGAPVPEHLRGLKLDRGALVEAYGEDFVHSKLRPLAVYRKTGGADPEAVAIALGYPSGDALVQALASYKGNQVRAAVEIENRMRARSPRAVDRASFAEVALDAVHNDRRVQALGTELELLAQLAKEPRPNVGDIRAQAAAMLGKTTPRGMKPDAYRVAAKAASARALQASAAGRFAEALVAKRQQLFASVLFAESRAALAEVDNAVAYAQRFNRPALRQRIGKAGGDLLETIDEVLGVASFRELSDVGRERMGNLRRWYDRMQLSGVDPQVPAALMAQIDASRVTHYRDMPIEEIHGIVATVRQLEHQADEAMTLRLAGQQFDLEQSAETLAAQVRTGLKERGAPPASDTLRKSGMDRVRRVARQAGAVLVRLRTLGAWIDGGQVGPFAKMVLRPLDRAQAEYLDDMRHYGEKVMALLDTHQKGQDLSRPVWIPTIGEHLTKGDLLAVALNLGNAGNRQRLQDGRQWGDVHVADMMQHLGKADWDFVQAVWDTLETLWPRIAEQQKRITGVEPPKVSATAVHTPFGSYRGGYYPVSYDRESPEWRAFAKGDDDSWFDQMSMLTLPTNGHTQQRVVKAKLPIKIDLGVMPQHLSRVLKDLTHRETVMGIRKLMRQPNVQRSLSETVGSEYASMIEDKLKQVATDQVYQAGRSLDLVARVSRTIRRHVGVMAMGFNVVTGLKQLLGVSSALEVLSTHHGKSAAPLMIHGYQRLLHGWQDTVDLVTGLSGEMRHRMSTADADIRLIMDQHLSGKMRPGAGGRVARLYDGATTHAHILIRYLQFYGVDVPLWLAAHQGAMRAGLGGDEARQRADDAVLTSQGAGGAKDTALIEGNVPGVELFTMFYSYASAYLQRQLTLGRDIGGSVRGGPKRLAAELPLLSARLAMLSVLPVILDDLVSQAVGASSGPDDDKGEGWLEYYASRVAAYQFYGLPLMRDLVGAKYGYRATPAQAIGESMTRLANDATKAMGGDDVGARKATRDALNVTGYALGLPLAGPWRHFDYLWRVLGGDEEPETVPEFAAAALVGKREGR